MHSIKTVETQVPVLKESFFTSTFRGRRKSSVTHILHKQHSLFNQQQCILENQQQSPKQSRLSRFENGAGQQTPEHRRLARSISIPLCKTAESAQADGNKREGLNEREDQRISEAAQGRRGEPVAVSASLHLLSSSASAGLGEPGSSSQLLSSVPTRQQGLASTKRALSNQETTTAAAAAAQKETQAFQYRPQQHGLIAKGVRLLRNMGSQETKQKKGGGSVEAAGDGDCENEAEEREVDKQLKKSNNKISKKGEHSKKKLKADSKGSVFSGIKIRKSLSKMKGLSKDDMLEDGRSALVDKDELKPVLETSLSPDEMRSDFEGDLSNLNAEGHQTMEEIGRKTSSGSDADLYSFHSAAETEDLLSDIQQAIQDQGIVRDRMLEAVPRSFSAGLTEVSEVPKTVISPTSSNLNKELFLSSAGNENEKQENEMSNPPLSRHSSSESGQPSSAPDTERSSGSMFPKTNSTYSFQDTSATITSFESAEEPQDELDSPDLPHQQSQQNCEGQNKSPCVPSVHLDLVLTRAPTRTPKRANSMDFSIERDEDDRVKHDFRSLTRRKSSMSISHLTADNPSFQPRRPSASSPSTVKLYPPVHPSYVKTTTRQLSSPVGSPLTSPNVPRKTDVTGAALESGTTEETGRWKQRSSSIGGLSADLEELEKNQLGVAKVPGQDTSEKSFTGGTYWTLGSKRAHGRKTSSSTVPYLDVFTGESFKAS